MTNRSPGSEPDPMAPEHPTPSPTRKLPGLSQKGREVGERMFQKGMESLRRAAIAAQKSELEKQEKAQGVSQAKQREPLEKLKQYPVFQNLRGKAETHQRLYRPNETSWLEKDGMLDEVLDSRTESAYNALTDARKAGMHQNEAEELALPNILLPSESDEA